MSRQLDTIRNIGIVAHIDAPSRSAGGT